MMQRVKILVVINLVFISVVMCYQKADAGMFINDKLRNISPARIDINSKDKDAGEQAGVLNFDNPDEFFPTYEYNNITYVWAPKKDDSLVKHFGTWHRENEYLDEVVPKFDNGVMSLKYNTPAGGFFVTFDPPVHSTEDGKIMGQISANLDLKRDSGSEGKVLVEIKYEDANGQEKLKIVDVTDQVKADGMWHAVDITAYVDILDKVGCRRVFTLAVVIEGSDGKFAKGTLYIDNIKIDPKLTLERFIK